MFTGIVEEIGCIKSIRRGARSVTIEVEACEVLKETRVGDSICTNGVCLTVTEVHTPHAGTKGSFMADVMPETMARTSFSQLKVGSEVNLERALTLNTRLGGHIVSGHIDGVGHVVRRDRDDNAVWLWVECSAGLMKHIVPKGSVTIQGVSLTVAKVEGARFAVSLIPHTRNMTVLHSVKTGMPVNLETDIIAKYVEKLLGDTVTCQTDKTDFYRQFMK